MELTRFDISQFSDINQLVFIFRIILAGICGILIGLERKNRSKEAGIRTHFIVSCAAALMMIVSKYAFFDVIQEGIYDGVEVRLDPSRIASTIASGIGFLGAGMIFVHRHTITGLTTAAGVWATSGVGMAIGSGMYVVGIAGTFIIVFAQIILHLNTKNQHMLTRNLSIENVNKEKYQEYITSKLSELGVIVSECSVKKQTDDGVMSYRFIIEVPQTVYEEDILALIDYKSSISTKI